jgi:hypothetical protein
MLEVFFASPKFVFPSWLCAFVVLYTTFLPISHSQVPNPPPPPRRGIHTCNCNYEPTKSSRAPTAPNRAASEIQQGLEEPGETPSEEEGQQQPEEEGQQQAGGGGEIVSGSAAAGVSAMITRSKLVEQLRDYQIRSQHK